MSRSFCACLLVLLVSASCVRTVQSGRDTIDLVKNIAADASSPEHEMLASLSKVPSSGEIYLLGSPELAGLIGDAFCDCDMFDNVRARFWSDDLKDFAGECFDLVGDADYTPYSAFAEAHGADSLRELSVRYALSFLSDKCNMSIYDLEGNARKEPAKMIVLADPWMALCGKFDIDTLFSLTSCKVPVISPQELLFNAAFAGEKKYFNVGLMCDSLYSGSGIYKALFEESVAANSIIGTRYFEAPSEDSAEGRLSAFLDKYIESGRNEPLDVLLVDDWSVDLEAMRKELEDIRDFSKEASMRYGKLVSPGFAIFGSSELTMSECYLKLREMSLFTHRIAQPTVKNYTVKSQPWGDKLKFLLIPSENVQN